MYRLDGSNQSPLIVLLCTRMEERRKNISIDEPVTHTETISQLTSSPSFLSSFPPCKQLIFSFTLQTIFQVFKSQLMKLSKKYNESIQRQKKQEELIEKSNKERIKLKKDLIEANFERKSFESQLSNQVEEVKKLRSELKAKGNMIVSLENARRKLEVELAKSGVRSAPCPRVSRSRNESGNGGGMRQRSYSVDRLNEQNKHFGRQLLKSGQSSATVQERWRNNKKYNRTQLNLGTR